MQKFIKKFYESSATSKDFTDTFDSFVTETFKNDSKKIQSQLQWNEWIYQPGHFPVKFDFMTASINNSIALE
jgi:hypothetical protein